MDFSLLIAAVNIDALIGGIAAVAALKILPSIWRWGYDHVIDWFQPDIRREVTRSDDGSVTIKLHHNSSPDYYDDDSGEELIWNDRKGDFVPKSYGAD